MTSFAAVILAAGEGKRMNSRTPKVLHSVCGKPMVSIVCETARAAGHDPVVLVVRQPASAIVETVGSSYEYVYQNEPLGTGDALLCARDAVGGHDNLLVMNADIPLITANTLQALGEVHIDSEAAITMLTATVGDPSGLGRVARDSTGAITAVVEHSEADPDTLKIREINAGVYCFRASWLWDNLPRVEASASGEIYLTDLIGMAARATCDVATFRLGDPTEARGVNTLVELSEAESTMRDRIRKLWMLRGVSMPDPQSVYIDCDVEFGADTIVMPNTHIRGATQIGAECEIGPNSIIEDARIGDQVKVIASVIEEATLESNVDVGPFSHIRPGTHLESDVHIGNFAEVKNSRLGRGTKSGHFSYIGDAQVGTNVNVGAGSITCNFDGEEKHGTVVGNDVFIGSDTMMVAPVTIGDRSYTSAGSVVTKSVPPDSGAIGAPARIRRKQTGGTEARTSSPSDPPTPEH